MQNSGPLSIAPATPGQRDSVADLWKRTGLTVSYNDPHRDFDLAAGKPGSDILVGTIDGRVVGSVMVGHDGHRGWLYYVAVDPDIQKQGIGAAMVAAGESWLVEHGIAKVQLMIRHTNLGVQEFYGKLDYEPSQVVVMAKWLKKP